MVKRFKFNVKEPNKEESLLLVLCRWENQQIKLSTKQKVIVATWNLKKQVCITSKELYSVRVNNQSNKINKFIETLSSKINDYYENHPDDPLAEARNSIQEIIESLTTDKKKEDKKKKLTATEFFTNYVEKKRIDPHTGRYIGERTKIHQRTVIKRLKQYISDNHLSDTFSTFSCKSFDRTYTNWCYSVKKYKQNTVYATYAVLKSLLNAAKDEGFVFENHYEHLKAKCTETDAVYLTEDEIRRIYNLDIKNLKSEGEVCDRSNMEITRDLFVIACWTGLRRSDINQLQKATFDIKKKTISITAEKTKRPVTIPMHPMSVELYKKYNGQFPSLGCSRSHTITHIRECARLAGIDDTIRIVENRADVVETLIYKKYQLVGMHTGRRSFATNMYKRRFPTIAIMKLTGHTTETNFLRYINPNFSS